MKDAADEHRAAEVALLTNVRGDEAAPSVVALIVLLARLLRFKPRVVPREVSVCGWRKRDRIVDFVVARLRRVLLLTPHQRAWAEATWRLRALLDVVGFAIDENLFGPQSCAAGGYVLAVGDAYVARFAASLGAELADVDISDRPLPDVP